MVVYNRETGQLISWAGNFILIIQESDGMVTMRMTIAITDNDTNHNIQPQRTQ